LDDFFTTAAASTAFLAKNATLDENILNEFRWINLKALLYTVQTSNETYYFEETAQTID
jgi:hypothetical protein